MRGEKPRNLKFPWVERDKKMGAVCQNGENQRSEHQDGYENAGEVSSPALG